MFNKIFSKHACLFLVALIFTSLNSFGQEDLGGLEGDCPSGTATQTQIDHALIIDETIQYNSEIRREQGDPPNFEIGECPYLSGPDTVDRYSEQTYYLVNARATVGDWWYISSGNTVVSGSDPGYYDDMIKVAFNTNASYVDIMIFRYGLNKLIASKHVIVDGSPSPLSAGTILTGDQSGWGPADIANILATSAGGGNCDSIYQYQWQYSYDSVFTDITGATADSLIIAPLMEDFFNVDSNAIFFRRMVFCGSDTLSTGAVGVYRIRPLNPGIILTSNQTVALGSTPNTLYATSASWGQCNHQYQYQWQYSYDNSSFVNITGATADSLILDNSIDQTIYFRRKVTCRDSSKYTASVAIFITMPVLIPTDDSSSVVVARKLPLNYIDTPSNFIRTYIPKMPVQDTALVNDTSSIEDVSVSTVYTDSYGRNLQLILKQVSPLKNDLVSPMLYDQFGRQTISYLPFASTDSVKDGYFRANPFYQDSSFYKTYFPDDHIIYSQQCYDGSPMNLTVASFGPGDKWNEMGKSSNYQYRTNSSGDSIHLWSIGINGEDDVPSTTSYYLPGTLYVKETTDEDKRKKIEFLDEQGKIILTRIVFRGKIKYGVEVFYDTYYVYDEMGNLRSVIPPKACDALKGSSANWNLDSTNNINSNLCYAYYYDNLGRVIMKRMPGIGKTYIAYDIFDRAVMVQDANLRLSNQWSFVLYDVQGRPIKQGNITTSLTKDQIITNAATSRDYPTLTGTYTITSETFYDDYSWVAGTGTALPADLDSSKINSYNFITSLNTSPIYAQKIKKSKRTRGIVTGEKQIILNSSQYIYSLKFYDDFGQAIQTAQTNYTGGIDIATSQYSFNGHLIRNLLVHQKSGTNAQSHSVLTKYSYDHAGRLLSIKKDLDSSGDVTISTGEYNELGQLKDKVFGNNIESQHYEYNIRGMVSSINSDFVNNMSAPGPYESGSHYFGEIISYEKGFGNAYYNGNISGIRWKTLGDRTARAYGYLYDNANRLIYADFSQQNAGSSSWTKDQVDYTVGNLSYDEEGNIKSLTQKGLTIGNSVIIDSLSYAYFDNSNLLKNVTDASGNVNPLGDFKDSTSASDDYAYDENGNIIRDNNRHMYAGTDLPGASFNSLRKPDSILIASKSKTLYYYDANGVTLRKVVKDSTTNTPAIKDYLFINGFVYVNDTLEYFLTEEGRIRYAKKRSLSGTIYYSYDYDYFIKDHQDNVRAVITEGKDTSFYQASMEPSRQGTEDALFSNIYTPVNTVYDKPLAFDSDTSNHKVSRLNASTTSGNSKVGPSIVLKVMVGDKVQINTYAFYNTTVQSPQSGVNLLSDILSILPGGIIGNAGGKLTAGNSTALSTVLSPNVVNFLDSNRTYDNTKPKAYLNWILFDEQFHFVASNSGVEQVQSGTEKQAVVAPLQTISKNGFLYIYTSNESPQDVYFDDLTITHYSGPLLQEQSYYPFGLEMKAINSKRAISTFSAYKFNAGTEFEDEGGLDYYNTFYRKYDAQIGRFTGVDMLGEATKNLTPFQFGNNNPIFYNDPSGALFFGGRMEKGPDGEYHVGWVNEMLWNAKGFFDFGDDGESGGGGGGGGGGKRVFTNFQGLTSTFILDKMRFGEKLKQDKNGNFGFWRPFTFDPGIKGDGHTNLAGVGVGTKFVVVSGINSYLYGGYNWQKTGYGWTAQIERLNFEAKQDPRKTSMPRVTPLRVNIPVVCIQVSSRSSTESSRNALVNIAWNNAMESFYSLLETDYNMQGDQYAHDKFVMLFQQELLANPNCSISFGACANITPPSYPKWSPVRNPGE